MQTCLNDAEFRELMFALQAADLDLPRLESRANLEAVKRGFNSWREAWEELTSV